MRVKIDEDVFLKDFQHYELRHLKKRSIDRIFNQAMVKIVKQVEVQTQEFDDRTRFSSEFYFFTKDQFRQIVRNVSDLQKAIQSNSNTDALMKSLCEWLKK